MLETADEFLHGAELGLCQWRTGLTVAIDPADDTQLRCGEAR